MDGKRSLSELIKEADKNKMQIVVIGMGAEVGIHAQMVAQLVNKPDVILVKMEDLPEEDQKKFGKDSLPVEQIISYKSQPIICTPDSYKDFVLYETKPFYQTLPRQGKLKGYQKNQSRNFKGRRK